MSDTAPKSPRKLYSIHASDARVRQYLKKGFGDVEAELKKRHPEVKPHLKPFLSRLDSIPDFWMQLPRQVEISLQKYGSNLNQEKSDTWHEVGESARNLTERLEERGERIPTILRVITVVDKLANHPDNKLSDLDDQLGRIAKAIQRNTLTSDQRDELAREERKAKREEKKTVHEERKAKRLSLKSPLQPVEPESGTPRKATLEEKKTRRLSYDSKLLGPVKVAPECVKNNPQFGVLGAYKQRALLNDWDTAAFDATLEKRILPKFEKLEGRSIDLVRTDLKALFNQRPGPESIRVQTLADDPHQLLGKEAAVSFDPLQLLPVIVRMLIRTALEFVPKGTVLPDSATNFSFPMTPATAYLDTEDFVEDYKQLQAALRLKTETVHQSDVPDNPHLATLDELKKTLSSPPQKRKGLEKQESGNDQDDLTPRGEVGSPRKSSSSKTRKPETTTTTTTATTTTTTIGTVGSGLSSVRSPSQRGFVRLYSASEHDDMSANLKPGFEAMVGQLNSLYEKYGPHAVSGTMKLLLTLKAIFEDPGNKDRSLDEMLPSATKKANLSEVEATALKDAGNELAKKAQILGRTEQARQAAALIVKVQNILNAEYEKVKG